MHHFILLIAALLLPAYSNAACAAQETVETAPVTQAKTVTLDIKNMTCGMCLITVKKALQTVPGVLKVQTDWESKTATVRYDGAKAEVEALTKATAQAGYPSTVKP
jgi:periplasmic mercuric ion binding protein